MKKKNNNMSSFIGFLQPEDGNVQTGLNMQTPNRPVGARFINSQYLPGYFG